jgi:transcription-repair coupling factor (superfamily II helicase)
MVITAEQSGAYLMLDDLEFFLKNTPKSPPVYVFPHLEILPYEPQAPELTIRMERLAPIQYYLEQSKNDPSKSVPMIVVAPIAAALKRLPSSSMYAGQELICKKGQEISHNQISEWLVKQGYEFRDLVAQRGDFSTRGDIIDIYSFSYPDPVRLEFWGDEIDSIRLFNVSTQRSSHTIDEIILFPGNEEILIESALKNEDQLVPFTHLLGDDSIVVMVESDEVEKEGNHFFNIVHKKYHEATTASEDHEIHLAEDDFHKYQEVILEPPEVLYQAYDDFDDSLYTLRQLRLTNFNLEPEDNHINMGFSTPEIVGEDAKEKIKSLLQRTSLQQPVLIVCDNTGQQNRLTEILDAQKNESPTPIEHVPHTMVGELHRGFSIPHMNCIICTDREIFGRYKRFRTPEREGIAMPLSEFMELKPGEYVVHIDHGIGKFLRIKRMEHEGKESEFLELEYAEGGVLYVPIDQIDRIGRYVGGENSQPTLSKLGTKNWERTKSRAKQSIEDMAEELLDLYATRSIRKGHSYPKDTTWQHEFEASFLYEETPDQWRAIEEVKRDMESEEPMDRLVCGDVGFGKTEVAIRAAFKAVIDGKQVAVLVPTTILCQQHYNNFKERFSDYPCNVKMLSRFISDNELKKVVKQISAGDVDLVVGTHRLLSKDVSFKDLGLVIIDEEQRFGVKHKERLRQLRKLVDTLTLTATPIPRTLYMSLSGIRHMSLVSTPPKNRLPIETYVMEWSNEVVENAILRELSRDGQVYIVHNRVESIYQVAHTIQDYVPHARVCVGHGQMSEHELEKVMMQFIQHEYDILVATTIIENGIDIPNVNTIIINNANHFGLSQLYQLRGRVGRDRHRAYCYLLVPSKKALSSIARRRLLALQEHNQLGSGFHLAMRDMELRGIGNILGRQQHGHIAAIGFDLYSKLLRDTVTNIKGNKALIAEWETTLEMIPKGSIPPTFIESSKQRMSMHQRIAKIKTPEEIDSLEEELQDIYGKLPAEVKRLIYGLRIRVRAHQSGFDIVQIKRRQGYLRYHLSKSENFNPMRVLQLDGQNGLKLVVQTKGENIAIEFYDIEEKGKLSDRVIPLIESLEEETDPDFVPQVSSNPKKEEVSSTPPKRKIKKRKKFNKY